MPTGLKQRTVRILNVIFKIKKVEIKKEQDVAKKLEMMEKLADLKKGDR